MQKLSILGMAAALAAVVGCTTPQPGARSSLPPVPSASDTNRFTPGAAVSSSSEVSSMPSDNTSIRGDGTTGATATRR